MQGEDVVGGARDPSAWGRRYDFGRLGTRELAELSRLLVRSDLLPAERARRDILLAQAERRT